MAKAGRKRMYDDPLDAFNVRLAAMHTRKARRYGDGNLGEGLRTIIENAPWPDLKSERARGAWVWVPKVG